MSGYDVACRFGCKAVSKLAKLILEKYPHIDAEYKLELQQLAVPACHLKSHTQSCQDQFTTDRFEGKGNLGNVTLATVSYHSTVQLTFDVLCMLGGDL